MTRSGSEEAACTLPAASSRARPKARAASRKRTAHADILQTRDIAGAVAESLDVHAAALEQRQHQVGERRIRRFHDVLTPANAAAAVPEHRRRQRIRKIG